MLPDEVAPLLSKLEPSLATKVLFSMKPKDQAELLARMTPEQAAAFSMKIMNKDFK